MRHNLLKFGRVALAILVFSGLTIAFVDFRGFSPKMLGHVLAHAQFVPALVSVFAGGVGAVILTGGIVAAALIGRIYCSAICPLGILQDIVLRAKHWFSRKKRFLPYSKAFNKVRQVFLWGAVVACLAGWVGFTLSLLDPYSNFGRIVSMLFRPLLTVANNAIVGTANAWGFQNLYRVDPAWASAGLLIFPAAFLTVIVVMSALRGRLYCNTVCPVGTVLGFVSRFAAFRITIDKNACTKCGDCLRSCKAQCIDLRNGEIDASRCVACYNCIGACEEHGVKYRFSWSPNPKPSGSTKGSPTNPAKRDAATDLDRRNFLGAVASGILGTTALAAIARAEPKSPETSTLAQQGAASRAVCPPGSQSVSRFLDQCTGCQLCVSACPTHVLQPALMEYGVEGIFKPQLKYSSAYCLFECNRCGQVCPDGAIELLDLAKKQTAQIGVADFYQSRCVVEINGTDCAACSEHCPTKAVTTVPFRENLRLPVLNQKLCIGCGACEYACPVRPVKAIVVTGRSVHAEAEKLVEKKATAPVPTGEFPF
ncbi:MAG: 4Fe-4S binding protein [Nibricoccus sp.]